MMSIYTYTEKRRKTYDLCCGWVLLMMLVLFYCWIFFILFRFIIYFYLCIGLVACLVSILLVTDNVLLEVVSERVVCFMFLFRFGRCILWSVMTLCVRYTETYVLLGSVSLLRFVVLCCCFFQIKMNYHFYLVHFSYVIFVFLPLFQNIFYLYKRLLTFI